MKRFIQHLVLLLTLVPSLSNGQVQKDPSKEKQVRKEHYIEFDNDNGGGMILHSGPLRLDDNIRVKINNVNRLVYDVRIVGNSEVFESQPPPGLAVLLGFQVEKEAATQEITEDLVGNAPAEAGKGSTSESEIGAAQNEISRLKEEQKRSELVVQGLSELQAKYLAMTDGSVLADAQNFLAKEVTNASADTAEVALLSSRIGELEDRVRFLRDSIQATKKVEDQYWRASGELTKAFKEYGEAFDALERMKSLYNKLVSIAYHESFNASEAARHLAEVIKDIPYVGDKDLLVRKYEIREDAMQQVLQSFRTDPAVRKFLKDDASVERAIKLMLDRFNKLKAAHDAYDFAKLFKDIDELYWTLGDPSLFTITSDPVLAEGDVVNFAVTIKGRSGVKTLSSLIDREFEHTEFVRGGIRFDWSSGIMFQIGLNDDKFRLEPNANDPTRVTLLANEQRQQFKPALGGLLHVLPRVEKHFRVSGIVGVGLNDTDLDKATFYLGAGLGFGRKEKVYLNIGLAGRKVDVLSGNYNQGQDLAAEGSSDLILAESVFRIGGFIGVTMTLNKQNKEDEKRKEQ